MRVQHGTRNREGGCSQCKIILFLCFGNVFPFTQVNWFCIVFKNFSLPLSSFITWQTMVRVSSYVSIKQLQWMAPWGAVRSDCKHSYLQNCHRHRKLLLVSHSWPSSKQMEMALLSSKDAQGNSPSHQSKAPVQLRRERVKVWMGLAVKAWMRYKKGNTGKQTFMS